MGDNSQGDIVIRVAAGADIDGLVASGTGLFMEDGATRDSLRNPGWPAEHGADYEANNLANPDMLVLVAEQDGAVIAHLTGGFYPASAMWTAPRAHLISIHVMAPWRGQGVGERLLEEFRSWAKARGAVQLRVTAYAANQGAVRFYQRHGFAPLETTLAIDI